MPTGGVTAEFDNISEWFHAGAYCLGMGSKLISKEYLKEMTSIILKNIFYK